MEEREKEIQVHKDILVSEQKAAEDERHKRAVELQKRKNKVKNLRIKYEGLVQNNKSSSGEVEVPGEHSQAYYVIKAAQQKEELQRYGDDLDCKIRKCEREIKALANTLDHLKVRNQNYREKFKDGADGADLDRKSILEEQCRAASETLFKRRRELQIAQSNFDTASRELMEIRGDRNELEKRANDVAQNKEVISKDLEALNDQVNQAMGSKDYRLNNARSVRGAGFDDSNEHVEILAEVEQEKHNHLLNALSQLVHDPVIAQELPDLVTEIE